MNKIYINSYPELALALVRDKYTCTKCGSVISVVVHHLDNSRRNGVKKMNNDLSNLTSLCRPCHAEAHGMSIRFNNPNVSIILELRNSGKTYAEIGSYLGITRQRVHQIIKKLSQIPSN